LCVAVFTGGKKYYLAQKFHSMKRISALALVMFIAIGFAFAKDRGPKHVELKGDFFTISYGMPAADASGVFTEGKPWGTGVGEVAKVKLDAGCMFAGRQVNPGTYALVTVPFRGEWLIFLCDVDAAATPSELTVDYLKTTHKLSSSAEITESAKDAGAFKMEVKDGKTIVMSWGKKKIEFAASAW
jgi:hypothetical protein